MIQLKLAPNAKPQELPQTTLAIATSRKLLDACQELLPELSITLQPYSGAPAGAFTLACSGAAVTISGDDEGLRCGLYTLMQELGFHWFSPQEEITRPQSPVTLNLALLEGDHLPDFSYRGLHICAGQHHYDDRTASWMSYNRMNRKLTHLEEVEMLGPRLNELGLRPDTTVHAYELLIPDEKYFDTHPEYFSLVGGRRIRNSEGGQLCLANQEMRAAFAEELCGWIAANRDIGVFGFCPNDGYGHCECSECCAFDTPEERATRQINSRIADFVQDICQRVAAVEPDAMLGHYSYSNFSHFLDHLPEPPKNLLVSCTIFHCYSHAISDPACPLNPPHSNRLKDIRSKVEHVYIYDYFSHNWGQLPAPYWQATIDDFKEYKRLGVDGWMSECNGADHRMWSAQWSAYYLAARLLWSCSGDSASFFKQLCQDRFGAENHAAAAPMERYYHILQQAALRHDICLDKDPEFFKHYFTPEVQAAAAAALAEAGNSPFVIQEKLLFEEQCKNYLEREKYTTPLEISAAGLSGAPQPLHLVDRSSQLPDLANNSDVWVAADAATLTFRFLLHETRMEQLTIDSESIFSSENIELFIDDGRNPALCYHFIIAADGRLMASECEGTRWNWAWEHKAQLQSKRHADAWELQITIPHSVINLHDNSFGFTVIRNRHIDGWRIYGTPAGGAYFKPANYIRCRIG